MIAAAPRRGTPARPRRGTRPGPRLTPSSGTPAGRASSAARSSVPSPPSTSTTSAPSAHPGRPSTIRGAQLGRQVAVGGRPRPTPRSMHPQPDAVRGQLRRRPRRRCSRLVGRPGVQDDQHLARHRPAPSSHGRGLERGRRRRRRRRRRGRSQRKYSTLPDGPGSGLATTPAQPQPSARAPRRRPRRTAASRSAGSRTTPPAPSRSLADLELRLHHRQQVAVRPVHAASAGSTMRSEMNDRSATMSSTGPPIVVGRERADVGAVVHPHPLVAAQPPDELPVADVDGDDLARRRGRAARR